MATYKKFQYGGNTKVQVESAIRDGEGKNIANNYAKQNGAYENLWCDNLLTDVNWRWVNNFLFGTGTVDTVYDGKATLFAIQGKTEWNGNTPQYVNVSRLDSVMLNLYAGAYQYGGMNIAHVPESNNENNGLCVFGTGVDINTVMEFDTDMAFSNPTEIALTDATNSMGVHYLHCSVPSDGYLRFKSGLIADGCISNVWGGNRVNQYEPYKAAGFMVGSLNYFPTGMKGITVNGENVVYDEFYADKYFERVAAYSFGSTPSVSYVAASGTYNIYRMSLSGAMDKGACEIGGSTKFAFSDVGAMSSSTSISADCMSLASGDIYFAIAQSEDTTYTYSEDTTVVDQTTFESELAAKGALYKLVDGEYVSVTTYEVDTTYYYISATNLHGLNGKVITDEITGKYVVYQVRSMDTSVYAGTSRTADDWSYDISDFGTEEIMLSDGFPVVPNWVVYYPVNVKETVQQLPNNYVSLQSAENMLRQVGALLDFDFDSISVDEETGNMKVNGLVDTKETIIKLTSFNSIDDIPAGLTPLNEHDKTLLKEIGLGTGKSQKDFLKTNYKYFQIGNALYPIAYSIFNSGGNQGKFSMIYGVQGDNFRPYNCAFTIYYTSIQKGSWQ